MSARGSNAALREGVDAVSKESGGAVDIHVVKQAALPGLLLDVCSGDAEAAMILDVVSQAQEAIETAPKRSPMLCASCPDPLRDGQYAFVLAIPSRDAPHQALGIAVCKRCGRDTATIRRKGVSAFSRVWPDLREISVSHPQGGRA